MQAGIVLLIVIAVPTFFQIMLLARKQRMRHDELMEHLTRLERKIGA